MSIDTPVIICDREGCYKPADVDAVEGDFGMFHVKCHGEEQLYYNATNDASKKLVWSNLSFVPEVELSRQSQYALGAAVAATNKARRNQQVLLSQGSKRGIKLTHAVRQSIVETMDTLIWLQSVCELVDE